jgi:hypothetical protein
MLSRCSAAALQVVAGRPLAMMTEVDASGLVATTGTRAGGLPSSSPSSSDDLLSEEGSLGNPVERAAAWLEERLL